MPEWLKDPLKSRQEFNFQEADLSLLLQTVALRLLAAAILGATVAWIYHVTRPKHENGTKGFVATIVLLSILLAMVVMTVNGNVARAFSLAGILAIVRFRTVVEDTRDSAFVICAVIMGMAAGAGQLFVALLGLPFIGAAAFVMHNGVQHKTMPVTSLKLRLGLGAEQQTAIEAVIKKYAESWTLTGSSTARQGQALDLCFQLRVKSAQSIADMVRELNKLEGIQDVEWKI
jgi:uncharacterized membrane protein YhiD involved in acid resistance